MSKKRSRKTLIRLLDQKASKDAKARHLEEYGDLMCRFCIIRGQHPQPADQCFHGLSRQHYSTRWLKENCFWSCASCNILYESDADFVADWVQWYKKKFGPEKWDWLSIVYHTPIPIKDWELEEKLNDS